MPVSGFYTTGETYDKAETALVPWPINGLMFTQDNVNPGAAVGGTWTSYASGTISVGIANVQVYLWRRTA